MDFGASLIASLASGLTSAGATGAAAGVTSAASGLSAATGAIGSMLPSASLVGGILSGSASLLQMTQLREAGKDKALNYQLAANDTKTDIASENVKSGQAQVSLKKALLDQIGERDAAYAASGVDLTFGTPAVAREQAVTAAEQALTTDSASTGFRIARLNEKADTLRLMANSARRSSNTQADIAGIEGAGRILRRG